MTDARAFLDDLNREYETLHIAKEDAFWKSMMGLGDDAEADRSEHARREVEWNRFLQDPARLADVRRVSAEANADDAEVATALAGWCATLEAHCMADAEARALSEEIVAREAALASARGGMELGFEHPDDGFVRASSVELGVRSASDPDPRIREAAWRGLRSIEPHVLANGFGELVGLRNRLGRMLGGEDYYDWKARRTERMGKADVFALLDDLERRTRDAGKRAIDELAAEVGGPPAPWDVRHLAGGDATRDEDPYFPFEDSVRRWGREFAALGIEYRGATLVLDLLDRKGKHENGFMHGPVPAWRDRGAHRPARIQFTANAIPGMFGSGRRATETLFHEGGHAAHFANIDMPAPCFGQEFAPTSAALAETQSMLLDSLLADSDWRARYARSVAGEAMPREVVVRVARDRQRLASWDIRQMLGVCYAERAVYELADDERTDERIVETLRDIERGLLGLADGSPRPVLSIPHLLAGESSAYYHGYLLALMAVYQTRAFVLARDGHLVGNPRLGPTLRDGYWRHGNARGFLELVQEVTGRPLDGESFGAHLSRTPDEAAAEADAGFERERGLPRSDGPVRLDAEIAIRHGNEEIASLAAGGDFEELADAFAGWVAAR